jgi:hypothetical protein
LTHIISLSTSSVGPPSRRRATRALTGPSIQSGKDSGQTRFADAKPRDLGANVHDFTGAVGKPAPAVD